MKKLLYAFALLACINLNAEIQQGDDGLEHLERLVKKYDLAHRFMAFVSEEHNRAKQAFSEASQGHFMGGRSETKIGPKTQEEHALEFVRDDAKQLLDEAIAAREKAAVEFVDAAKAYFLQK